MSKHDNKNLNATPEFIEFANRCIDDFINCLRVSALYYKIHIDTVYEPKRGIVEIYAQYDGAAVYCAADVSFIIQNNSALSITMGIIRNEFIEVFEERERNQEKTEVDERWELIELGGIYNG